MTKEGRVVKASPASLTRDAGDHVISLPSAMRLHNVHHVLRGSAFFLDRPKRIVLEFHPRYSQFEPYAVAMLAAWSDFWTTRGVPVECRNVDAKGVSYAKQLGLFEFLPGGPVGELAEHEEAGRFVALRKIQKQSQLTTLVAEMGAILRTPEMIESAQYAVAEMCRNVLEHAGAAAFVCVQAYASAKRVSLGIVVIR